MSDGKVEERADLKRRGDLEWGRTLEDGVSTRTRKKYSDWVKRVGSRRGVHRV